MTKSYKKVQLNLILQFNIAVTEHFLKNFHVKEQHLLNYKFDKFEKNALFTMEELTTLIDLMGNSYEVLVTKTFIYTYSLTCELRG